MRPICLDFDDLCDETVDELDKLVELKERCPGLKTTLFTIPARCSIRTLKRAQKHEEWLKLAPHGWRHTRGECLSWSDEEAEDKIRCAAALGIDYPVFKAPAWLIDGDTYKACERLDYTIASHAQFRIPNTGVREYIYNYRLPGHKWYGAVHGHLTDTPATTNYIGDMLDRGELSFPDDTEFKLPHELAKVID